MNILYIFGNGFDKAQGMATSYPEFYKYLQEHVTSSSNLLNQMKAEITDVSNNADEFYDFYFELNEHLQSYLTKENEKFLPTGRASFEDSSPVKAGFKVRSDG